MRTVVLLVVIAVGALAALGTSRAPAAPPAPTAPTAPAAGRARAAYVPSDEALHRRAIVVDTHADTTQFVTYAGADLARPQPDLQIDLAKAAAGGLDAEMFSIFIFPKRFK